MALIEKIRKQLADNADEKIKQSTRRFFKEEIDCYGLKAADVTGMAKEIAKEIKGKSKESVFGLCDALWASGKLEEGSIACSLAYARRKEFQKPDWKTFEKWVDRYVSNWASCDTLCNHTIGAFVETFPDYVNELKKWAKSGNRWKKRAAAVSLIVPARKGLFLGDIFEIADILLLDADDMVQKGYGWMLKVAGDSHQKEVFDYVMAKKAVMPRIALRYAIEKMPENLRKQAMKK